MIMGIKTHGRGGEPRWSDLWTRSLLSGGGGELRSALAS